MTGADYAARLELQLESLSFVFPTPTASTMKARPKPDKWSAHEHLSHLVLHSEITAARIRRILTEDSPRLASYKAETEPIWPTLVSMSTEELQERFRSTRKALCGLARDCTSEQLKRIGIHTQFGEMDIGQWLELFLIHEAHHLYVIAISIRSSL